MVFKRFVSGLLTNPTSNNDNEKEVDIVKSTLLTTNENYDKDDIIVTYDSKTKYYEINFEKQKKLANDIDQYVKSKKCQSFVSIELKNSENVKVPTLLLSYASCLVERIVSQQQILIYFIKAKEFGEEQMKMILNFLLTGTIKFQLEDITELFSIARCFEMCSICTILETSMLTSLKSNKSLLPILLNFSAEYKNIISTKTKIFLVKTVNYYLNDFVFCQNFLKLTPQALVMVLSSDLLKVSSEKDIFRLGILYMCNKEIYGIADPIFNCIRFNFCSKELIINMKNELEKLNKKYLSYVFECYYRESEKNWNEYDNKFYKYLSHNNFNRLSNRNTDSSTTVAVSKFLEKSIQNIIKENETKKNIDKTFNIDNYGLKKGGTDVKQKKPQKFKVLPATPKFLRKKEVNQWNKENDKKKVEYNDDGDAINPYKNISKFNERLFSSDSVYEINKFKNVFNINDSNKEVNDTINLLQKTNIRNDPIEPNPYYYALKDREHRKYTVDSIYDINQLTSFNSNNQETKVVNNSHNKNNQSNFAAHNLNEYITTLPTQKESTMMKKEH